MMPPGGAFDNGAASMMRSGGTGLQTFGGCLNAVTMAGWTNDATFGVLSGCCELRSIGGALNARATNGWPNNAAFGCGILLMRNGTCRGVVGGVVVGVDGCGGGCTVDGSEGRGGGL